MSVPGHPRFAPSELNLDRSLRSRRHAASLLRHVDDGWVHVATFGSIAEAQEALDEQVGEGHGEAGEYQVVSEPSRYPKWIWAGVGVAALIAVTILLALFR